MGEPKCAVFEGELAFRTALVECLAARGIACVAQASAPTEFANVVRRNEAEVAIVALEGAGEGDCGPDVLRALRIGVPEVRAVVLASSVSAELVALCSDLDVMSVLSKASARVDDIASAVRGARRGERSFPAQDSLFPEVLRAARDARMDLGQHLSPRERQVLALLTHGYDNLKISAELGISERTVKAHVSALYRKLQADNRVELALKGRALGAVVAH